MKPTIPEKSEDFKNMCDLLSVYSEGSAQLKAMQGEMDSMFLSLVDDKKTEYAELQLAVTNAETGLEVIALRHPEWFTEKRIIKTPFGTVKFARSTVLEIKNEEPAGTKAQFIRQIEKLDVEALEKLDDDVLKLLKVKRVQKDNFSVVAASVDLGKAVKEAAGKEVAA
jgi:hypothetical protein